MDPLEHWPRSMKMPHMPDASRTIVGIPLQNRRVFEVHCLHRVQGSQRLSCNSRFLSRVYVYIYVYIYSYIK